MASVNRKKEIAAYAVGFLLVIALDQWFKRWITLHIPLNAGAADNIPLIPGVIHLTHIHNYGAAFGMMQGGRWLFLLLLAVFCALVVWALYTNWLPTVFSRWIAVLATAGAVGNGIDRAILGYVVDMFEVEFIRFAVFNIADAVMNVCTVLFILWVLFYKEKETPPEQAAETTPAEESTEE